MSASWSALDWASSAVGASTITRTSGSVPLARSRTRPGRAEFGLDSGDVVGHQLGHVGHAGADAHVDEHLRQRRHRVRGDLGEWASRSLHDVEQRERRQQAVAGRGVVGEDDVTALFAAERVRAGGERLENVSIPDVGDDRHGSLRPPSPA